MGECRVDVKALGQQISGPTMYLQQVPQVVTACVVLHSLLCNISERGQFQVDNLGLNLVSVLPGNQMSYQGRKPTEATKA